MQKRISRNQQLKQMQTFWRLQFAGHSDDVARLIARLDRRAEIVYGDIRPRERARRVVKISDAGISAIKQFEGTKLKAYQDSVGVWTIGCGHTKGVRKGDVITEGQCEVLLRQDLQWVEEVISQAVTVPLTQGQYDALCSFIFNVGGGAFKKSTMRKKLNAKDYDGAALEFPRWNKAGGKALKGLTTRRLAEQKMFLGDG